jgi:predicted dehydrogenase
MSTKLKFAIIGIGRMGITHYSIINNHPGVDLVAVVDKSKLVLNILSKYVNNVNTYTDHSELFKKEKLDAVIICTPPVIHYKIALEALSRNLHLFIEKPCTLERIKAQELSQLSNKKGLVNQVGYVNRFNDCFIKVKI